MKNRLCAFFIRLTFPGLAGLVALVLLSPALALADTITVFDVSGTGTNVSGGSLGSCAAGAICAFSGTLQIDVTTGTLVTGGVDLAFPGLPDFDSLILSTALGPSNWLIIADTSSTIDQLGLDFITAPTPGSLVGFTGGAIDGVRVVVTLDGPLYTINSGSATLAPEPSSLLLFAGSLGWLVLGLTRRRFARMR